jgi:hypothetical protein
MTDKAPPLGEFDHAIAGLFDFVPKDTIPTASYFGLQLSDTYVMAHLRDSSRTRQLHVVRPVAQETTAGMSFSASREDGIYSDPRGGEFLRGGYIHRAIDSEGNLTLAGSSGTWSGADNKTLEMSFGRDAFWRDSGRLDIRGRAMGPGLQLLVPWREGERAGGILDASIYYEVEGTLFGEAVSGFLILEMMFSPAGRTLHDSVLRRRYVGAWNAFATRFEDGSTQYGQIGFGAGPFRYANIVDGGKHICSPVASVETKYGPDGMGSHVEYRLANGERWECLVGRDETLRDMTRAAAAQGSNCQIHKGSVGRVGDARSWRNRYAILEWFPDRLVNNASDEEIALPAGF